MKPISIDNAVFSIKKMIEKSIRDEGIEGKNNLIRSQKPICMIHDAIKNQFIEEGINRDAVFPHIGEHKGEISLAGFFKYKAQDICLIPSSQKMHEEQLPFKGLLNGKKDKYGQALTERILTVNVRSQLSSIAKNFDTLYERTFAEPLNLHLRCPQMVLGDLYMIPVKEYDDSLAKQKKVGFKTHKNIAKKIEKYIQAFTAVNNRSTIIGEEYKYERVCLLVVDFSKPHPVIYNTDEELKAANLLPQKSLASINEMNFPTFVPTLLNLYKDRFGDRKFM